MGLTVGLLAVSALAIYLACEFFVNGVEWLGRYFGYGDRVTGSVLAAFGTALPESVVTLVAVALTRTVSSQAIGIGATLGGPLVLGTVTYAAVGAALLLHGRRLVQTAGLDFRGLARTHGLFLAVFAAKISAGIWGFPGKPYLAFGFFAVYLLYVWSEASGDAGPSAATLEPLIFAKGRAKPSIAIIAAQTLGSLAVIFFASRIFVAELETIAPLLGLPPQLAALFLSPIATELPETLNALIWVRAGKTALAVANISGAMMIQATVPTALSIFFTPWILDRALFASAAATALASLLLALGFYWRRLDRLGLLALGSIYVVFAAAVVAHLV